jgi:protein OS-9
MFDNQRYLCSIPYIPPVIPSSPSNRTVDDEANELALAVHRGQKLLKGMEGNCIYFISGWWSYSFCYNEGVRQFHPLPSGRNVPMYPPVEDKSVGAYVLGRFHGKEASGDDHIDYDDETSSSKKASKKDESVEETGIAKLEVKGHEGSTRYLAQHLKGGTVCDLTGEARSIEVQVGDAFLLNCNTF